MLLFSGIHILSLSKVCSYLKCRRYSFTSSRGSYLTVLLKCVAVDRCKLPSCYQLHRKRKAHTEYDHPSCFQFDTIAYKRLEISETTGEIHFHWVELRQQENSGPSEINVSSWQRGVRFRYWRVEMGELLWKYDGRSSPVFEPRTSKNTGSCSKEG